LIKTGTFIKVVILAKVVFFKYFVNSFTSPAAEILFAAVNICIYTYLAAVKTADLFL
jgi:hypothetical protein